MSNEFEQHVKNRAQLWDIEDLHIICNSCWREVHTTHRTRDTARENGINPDEAVRSALLEGTMLCDKCESDRRRFLY